MDGHCEGWDQSLWITQVTVSCLLPFFPVGSELYHDAGFVKATCCSARDLWASTLCPWVILVCVIITQKIARTELALPQFVILAHPILQIHSMVGSPSASVKTLNQLHWNGSLMNLQLPGWMMRGLLCEADFNTSECFSFIFLILNDVFFKKSEQYEKTSKKIETITKHVARKFTVKTLRWFPVKWKL